MRFRAYDQFRSRDDAMVSPPFSDMLGYCTRAACVPAPSLFERRACRSPTQSHRSRRIESELFGIDSEQDPTSFANCFAKMLVNL